jgi:serine/threonine-protein phosphatase 2B catalytic subunit
VYVFLFFPTVERSSPPRLKLDIENECLPLKLFDTEEAKALALHAHSQSLPEAPSPGDLSLTTFGSIEASITAALSSASLASSQSQSSVGGPSTPTMLTSSLSKVPFWGRHGKQASLGTTRMSPSMRRWSLESTISMIQEALDGKDLEAMANERTGTGKGEGGYFGGGESKGSG